MIRNLAPGSPISPLLQTYLKVNFIPANRKLKFTETQLFSFQKSPLIIRPWPCGNLGNLVYLVYRFVTRLFIAKPLLQVHHISEEKALPQVHTLFLSNTYLQILNMILLARVFDRLYCIAFYIKHVPIHKHCHRQNIMRYRSFSFFFV